MAPMNSRGYDDFMKSIKNEKPDIERIREGIEDYIIDINNKLYDLCQFMNLDLDEIKQIHPDKEVRKKRKKHGFGDDEKRAIVASVVASEKTDDIKKQAMEAAGITEKEYNSLLSEDLLKRIKNNSPTNQKKLHLEQSKKEKEIADEMSRRIKSRVAKGEGLAPPRTNWERIDVSKDEKQKILQSIRSNPKSNIFSKEFKWEPKDFLEPFKYLESSSKYNGPLIISVLDKKRDLEKYSRNSIFSDEISKIYLGKYVFLSIYDITAKESKTINVGLEYLSLDGRLKFDRAHANGPFSITESQKVLLKEFFDTMEIEYDSEHKDLKPISEIH